jgi:hypothetical protein
MNQDKVIAEFETSDSTGMSLEAIDAFRLFREALSVMNPPRLSEPREKRLELCLLSFGEPFEVFACAEVPGGIRSPYESSARAFS